MDKYKITDSELESGVVAAPNILNDTPQENKSVFDRLPRLIANKVNGFIDAVISKFADYYNKTEIDSKENVLNEAINTKANVDDVYKKDETYSKNETEQKINEKVTELGKGDMSKAVYDTDGDGVVDKAKNAENAENAETSQNVRGYWLSKTDANGNPTDELYAHWYEDSETGEVVGGGEEEISVEEIVENIPTASKDTRGLVKVGDGLTIKGDVLSVDEGEFELIETITLEETTSEIIRSNLVGYKAMMINVLFPAGTVGYCYAGVGDAWMRKAVGTVTVGSAGSTILYCLRTIFKQTNGIWDMYGYHGLSGSKSDVVGQVSAEEILTIKELPQIKYARIFGTGLVTGTVITIWGVRA